MIVALVALFISATGVAVASIPSGNGVSHACYSKNGGALQAISGGKRCPRGTRALSWNRAGARGATGARGGGGATGAPGAPGAPGANGTAVAFARVAADGTLEPGDSGRENKNVVAVNVEHDATTGAGHYCFGGLPFGVASAMVSPDSAGDINGNVLTSVAVQRGVTLGSCDAQHQQARVTTLVAGVATDHRFQIWFEQTGGPQIVAGPGGD